MKIVTASGKQKVVMTRKEWKAIGKKAGWIKKTAGHNKSKETQIVFEKYGPPGTKITKQQADEIFAFFEKTQGDGLNAPIVADQETGQYVIE